MSGPSRRVLASSFIRMQAACATTGSRLTPQLSHRAQRLCRRRRRQRRLQQQQQRGSGEGPAATKSGVDLEQRLKTLKELRDKNLISEEAYRAKMQELLSEL